MAYPVLHPNGKTYEFPDVAKAQQFLSLYPDAELLNSGGEEQIQEPPQNQTEDVFDRLIFAESSGRQFDSEGKVLRSSAGGLGITQSTAPTAGDPGYKIPSIFDLADQAGIPYAARDEQSSEILLGDENLNLQFGKSYFSGMLNRYNGDEERALVAYNWGPGNADKWDGSRDSLPEETRNYVAKILDTQTQTEIAPEVAPEVFSVLHSNGKTYDFPDENKAQQFLALYPDSQLVSSDKENKNEIESESEDESEVGFIDSIQKGAKQVMTTWYTLADMFQDSEESALKLKNAQEEYDALASDPRIAQAIQQATEASDLEGGSFTAAAKTMLGFFLRNPGAAVNFFGEQLPAIAASLPFGGVGGFAAKTIGTKLLTPAIGRLAGTAGAGSSLNSAAVVAGALGPNYMEGLRKFDGDVEKAREYATTKTMAEVPPNAIAGAFIGFAPFSRFIKSPTGAAVGNVSTQFGIQGTGGALGAKFGAESVGEEAQMGELALEALGEGITSPIDIVASRASIIKSQEANAIIDASLKGLPPEILENVDLEPLRIAVKNAVGKKTPRADIDRIITEYVISKAQGIENDVTEQVDTAAQENAEQTAEAEVAAIPTVLPQAVKDAQEKFNPLRERTRRNRIKGAPEGLINPDDLSADEKLKRRQRASIGTARPTARTGAADQNVKDIQSRLDAADGVPVDAATRAGVDAGADQNVKDIQSRLDAAQQKQNKITWLDDDIWDGTEVTVEADAASEFDDPVSTPKIKPKIKPKSARKKKDTLNLTTTDQEIILEEAKSKVENTTTPVKEKVKKYSDAKNKSKGLGDVAKTLRDLSPEELTKFFDPEVDANGKPITETTELGNTYGRTTNKSVSPFVKAKEDSEARLEEAQARIAEMLRRGQFYKDEARKKRSPDTEPTERRNYRLYDDETNTPKTGFTIKDGKDKSSLTEVIDNETGYSIKIFDRGTPQGEKDAEVYVIDQLAGNKQQRDAVVGTTKKDAIAAVKKLITLAKKETDVADSADVFKRRVLNISRKIYGEMILKGNVRVPTNLIPRGENRNNYLRVKEQLQKEIANPNIKDTARNSFEALLWVLEKNPSIATNLEVHIDADTKKAGKGAAAYASINYTRAGFERSINLFTDKGDGTTALHELLHHTEQFLPTDVRVAIKNEWKKEVNKNISDFEKQLLSLTEAEKNSYNASTLQAKIDVYKLIEKAAAGDLRAQAIVSSVLAGSKNKPAGWANTEAIAKALKSIKTNPELSNPQSKSDLDKLTRVVNGIITTTHGSKNSDIVQVPIIPSAMLGWPMLEFYGLTDPSEWWAVNGSKLLVKAKEKDSPSWVGAAKKWLKDFVKAILNILGPGYDKNNGLVRGLEYIIGTKDLTEQSGMQLSGDMLEGISRKSLEPNLVSNIALGTLGSYGMLLMNKKTIEYRLNDIKRTIDNSYTPNGFISSYQAAISVDNDIGKVGAEFAGKNLTKVLSDSTLAASLLASDTFSILEVLRKSTIKSLGNLANNLDKQIDGLNMERQEILEIGKKTYDQLASFILASPVGGKLLQEIMTDSTVMRFDPSEFSSIVDAIKNDKALIELRAKLKVPNITDANRAETLGAIDGRTKDMRSVYSRWEVLGKIKKAEGHALYKNVRNVYAEMLDRNEEIQLENISKLGLSELEATEVQAKIKEMYKQIRDEGVYFPLLRFGDYWIKVKKGPDTGLWTFEKESERDAFMAQVEKDLGIAGSDISEETLLFGNNRKELRNTYENTDSLLGALYNNLNNLALNQKGARNTLEIVEQIKDQILNVYLTSLPDRDLRTRLAKRKATPGFSYDQARGFSFYMGASSAQLPRLRRKREVGLIFSQARDAIKNQPYQVRVNKIIDELEQRARAELSPPTQSEFLRKIENISGQSIFYTSLLGVDTALQNYNVLATFAPAVLGQKYGVGSLKTIGTYLALGKGAQQIAVSGITATNIDELNIDTEIGSLGNLSRVKNNPFLKAAFQYAHNRGLFGTNYLEQFMSAGYSPTENDVGQPTGRIKSSVARLGKLISFPFRYSERHVREIVYLSAVEEEFKAKTKALKAAGKSINLNEEQVIEVFEEAKRLTKEIAFDYSRFNKAFNKATTAGGVGGFLARNASRLQSFRLQAIAFVIRNFAMSLGAIKHLPPGERRAAFSKLMTFSVMTALTAGTTGVMGYSIIASIVNGILNELDEDDPTIKTLDPIYREDFTLYLKEVWLPENVANEKLRLMLTNGVIDTATGYNFSAMLNMDSMIAPSLYGSPSASLDMRAQFGSLADTFLGVGYDRVLDLTDTISKVRVELVRGNFDKGLSVLGESLRNTLPNVKDMSEAYRLASVGEIDKNTNYVNRFAEDIPTSEVLMRVLGREPLEISESKDAELRMTKVYGEARAKRTMLRRLLKDNIRDMQRRDVARPGTTVETMLAERKRIYKEIYEFNRNNPTATIDIYNTAQKIAQELVDEVTKAKARSGVSQEEARIIKERSGQ